MASRNDNHVDEVIRGSRNVFADLGYPDAAERQAKLRLAYALNQLLDQRRLTQASAAKALGVTQPKVSALRHYKLSGRTRTRRASRSRPASRRSHASTRAARRRCGPASAPAT